MTKLTATALKPGNGKPTNEDLAGLAVVKTVLSPELNNSEEKKTLMKIEPEKPVIPAPEPKKEMTLIEKILKVENLQLVVEKRAKLVQTRSELERFQVSSNDFNCSMRLNDSDGNVFTTSFTPGIKKVIDFLKSSFDASIADVEGKIKF
jgi:nitric oxide reductase activation protein